MDLRRYDFLDFGASKGGCIDFAVAKLGGKREPLREIGSSR